ncbi:hypothetical protein AB0I28_24110 [Phytomonospora sp. NPDC050363]|uniref:hypothetical protein n=1 Tax=Phytomonospora sp. NPDC050363 TaxID=3155642 RepID=UPI0033EF1990
MVWTWQLEDGEGERKPGPEESHQSQGDAESWLGMHWRELTEQGAATVILLEDDRVEYRMSLNVEQE